MKTVAVLDDDETLVELYKSVLEEEGYAAKEVIFSKNLPTILENIRATQADVLILDVHLPGLGSFEIIQGMEADAELARIAILICSASRPSLTILRRMIVQANLSIPEVLEKPFDLDDLCEVVQKLANQK